MKKVIEGQQLLHDIPQSAVAGIPPVVHLKGLSLDDENCWQYPTVLVGSVGSGKSTLMDTIQRAVMQNADKAGDTVVIFAAKPDVLRYRRAGDPVIRVSSAEPGSCWNLFREMDASDHPELTLREISEALFAEQKRQTNQIFFPEAAQDVFFQSARFMYDYSKKHGTHISNAQLIDFLTQTSVNGDYGWLHMAELYPQYFSSMRDFIGESGSLQGMGVLSEIRTMLARTFYESFSSDNGAFSAINAVKRGGRFFIYYEYNKAHSALPLFKIILDLMLQQAMSAQTAKKIWFLLDEFAQLPKMEHLVDALSFGRDPSGRGAGGIRIVAALQSVQLLTRHYSEAEAKTLLSLFPNLVMLRVADPMSRAALADRYGMARVLYRYIGEGGKPVSTDADQKVITDADFAELLKPGQAFMSLPGVSAAPFFFDGWTP